MRTVIVFVPVIGAVFLGGVACGLALRAPVGPIPRVRLPGTPGIGIDIGFLPRRRRLDANRPAADVPEARGADEDWDTYQPGVESDDGGGLG